MEARPADAKFPAVDTNVVWDELRKMTFQVTGLELDVESEAQDSSTRDPARIATFWGSTVSFPNVAAKYIDETFGILFETTASIHKLSLRPIIVKLKFRLDTSDGGQLLKTFQSKSSQLYMEIVMGLFM